MTLGKFIKDYRDSQSMSQAAFASASGISKGYISMLEQNKNPATGLPIAPSIDVFGKVASAVGISLDELLRLVDSDQPISLALAPSTSAPEISPDLKYLSEALAQLNDDGAQKLLDYAADLVASGRYAKIERPSPLQIAARSGDDLSKADFSRIILPDAEDDVPV